LNHSPPGRCNRAAIELPEPQSATVDVDWIASHLADPGVRFVEVDVSPTAYDAGHIPGAVLWNAYSDLRDDDYLPIAETQLRGLLSRSDISAETTVVVYGYAAPLGFWLLKTHGHDNVRVLMGSRDQWHEAGHEWDMTKPPPADADYPDLAQNPEALASRGVVEQAIGDPARVLLDVRSEPEYGGERFWPSGATEDTGRAGHVPGAVNVPIDSLRTEDGRPLDPEELRRTLANAGITGDKAVIVYCTIGNRASEAWFALRYLLRFPDVRVYYGSWVEWGKTEDAPVEI
jgi:thiosulfate/3-mercaptopyruvate sulfurtransferase